MFKEYRYKDRVVAIKYDGTNSLEIIKLLGPFGSVVSYGNGETKLNVYCKSNGTGGGERTLKIGDYIIRDAVEEFSIIGEDYFLDRFESVN